MKSNYFLEKMISSLKTNSYNFGAYVDFDTVLDSKKSYVDILNQKLYTIKTIDGKLVYVDVENKPFVGTEESSNSKFIWMFEYVKNGMYHVKNLHTQSYISDVTLNEQVVMGDIPLLLYVEIVDKAQGIISITTEKKCLCVQSDGKIVGGANNQESKTVWYLEQKEEGAIKYSVSLGANTSGNDTKAYSTLYLAYNAIIPEGVTASTITCVDASHKIITNDITGRILPAHTPVLLSSEIAKSVEFIYTSEKASYNVSTNILQGNAINKIINCGDKYNLFMLGKKSGCVAFYWTYENRDENGNKVSVNGTTNHNQGGYVLCNANKAYFIEREKKEETVTLN